MDFLLGISLVLIALAFTMQFVPGLFAVGNAGESSLDYTAYRTATILTEDTGWWENSTANGTDWEVHSSNAMRIGLAVDDEYRTRLTNNPNVISEAKIQRFMLLNESKMIEMLGLYNNIDGSRFAYGYNISITQDNSPIVLNNTTIHRGTIPVDDMEIAKITRIVMIEDGTTAVFTGEEITGSALSKARLNVTGPLDENITVQLRELNITGANPAFLNASMDGTILSRPGNYSIYTLEGWTENPLSGNINSDDVVCLNFEYSLFNMSKDYRLELEFSNITFTNSGPPYVNYENYSKTHYEPARINVEVW
ncbi:MAG: hypothetical protein R2741_10275 [Methanolobus sp.]